MSIGEKARFITTTLIVIFGLVIVGRGLVEGAPWSYVVMGAAMSALGVYRLRNAYSLYRRKS